MHTLMVKPLLVTDPVVLHQPPHPLHQLTHHPRLHWVIIVVAVDIILLIIIMTVTRSFHLHLLIMVYLLSWVVRTVHLILFDIIITFLMDIHPSIIVSSYIQAVRTI